MGANHHRGFAKLRKERVGGGGFRPLAH
jgi:hypothetical protein